MPKYRRKSESDDENTQEKEPQLTTSIILDGTYFFMALYNKLDGQWKKKIYFR